MVAPRPRAARNHGRTTPRPFLGALSAVRAGPALLVVAGHLVTVWTVMGHRPCTPVFAQWSAEGVALLKQWPARRAAASVWTPRGGTSHADGGR